MVTFLTLFTHKQGKFQPAILAYVREKFSRRLQIQIFQRLTIKYVYEFDALILTYIPFFSYCLLYHSLCQIMPETSPYLKYLSELRVYFDRTCTVALIGLQYTVRFLGVWHSSSSLVFQSRRQGTKKRQSFLVKLDVQNIKKEEFVTA